MATTFQPLAQVPNRSALLQAQLAELMRQGGRPPQTIGEGIYAVGDSIANVLTGLRAKQAAQESQEAALAAAMGIPGLVEQPGMMPAGGGAGPPTPGTPGLIPRDTLEALAAAGMLEPVMSGFLAQQMQPPKPPEAPKTRSYVTTDANGNAVRVTEQWNAAAGQWEQVAAPGPAFAPPATTTVNLPPNRPPLRAGEKYVFNESGEVVGIEAIPGGEVAREQEAEAARAERQQQAAQRDLNIVQREVGRVLDEIQAPDWWSGVVARTLSVVPGTPAYRAQQALSTLGAIISFDRLNEMRANSPTGGALGNVTEGEIERLQRVYGSLDISQDPATLAENIRNFERELYSVVNGRAMPEQPEAPAAGAETTAPPPKPGDVEDGYRFKGGDWRDPNSWERVQ